MEFVLINFVWMWMLIVGTFLLWLNFTPNGKRFRAKYIEKDTQSDLSNYLEKKQNYRNMRHNK